MTRTLTNELTLLRFYGTEDKHIPSVRPAQLTEICDRLMDVYQRALDDLGFGGTVHFEFAAAPRRGSLEVALHHILSTVTIRTNLPARALAFQRAVETAARGQEVAIAALLYTVIFGGNGLVDIKLNGKDESADKPDAVSELKVTASAETLPIATTTAINSLLRVAADTGVRRIEVTILDERPVVIFSADLRHNPLMLMSNPSIDEPAGNAVTGLSRTSFHVIDAKWEGKPAKIFAGVPTPPTNGQVIVIWASKRGIPAQGVESVQVQARFIARSELTSLTLLDPRPLEMDGIRDAILVTGAASYE